MTREIADDAIALLRDRFDVEVRDEGRPIGRRELLAAVRGRSALVSMLTDRIDDEVLEAAGEELRIVANHAVGIDNVDVEACTRRRVLVTNTLDVLTEATADLTWGLILAAVRRIVEGDRLVRGGRAWSWAPLFMLGRQLGGRTLGIVGLGRIGRAVAARARGFGMRVLYHSRTRQPDAGPELGAEHRSLDDLLREADVVTLHVPLHEATRRLFGEREFRSMKPTAVFVNTSRGAVVDEAALADALARGEIFAAGLDVYEREPEVHPRLLELDNVVLAPHLGSATVDTRVAMGVAVAQNVVAALEGNRPPNLVNDSAWETA
ncbi:MAG TPA: D-glycerate dehydrogenase [Actinomycetota bacterium]|nr:D-glycerate dehydrogenase [Actinomycetota bacterium]